MQSRAVTGMVGLILTATLAVVLTGPTGFAQAAQQPPAGGGARGGGRGFSLPPLLMETDAFPDGGIIPQKYTGRGGVQPGFKFSNAPAGTVSYAIIFHDVDVAFGGNTGDVFTGWPGTFPPRRTGSLKGACRPGRSQGNNLSGQANYMGPGAPAGPRYHHYVFELYALNANVELPATASRDDLLKAMQGKVVAKAAYVGRFRQDAK